MCRIHKTAGGTWDGREQEMSVEVAEGPRRARRLAGRTGLRLLRKHNVTSSLRARRAQVLTTARWPTPGTLRRLTPRRGVARWRAPISAARAACCSCRAAGVRNCVNMLSLTRVAVFRSARSAGGDFGEATRENPMGKEPSRARGDGRRLPASESPDARVATGNAALTWVQAGRAVPLFTRSCSAPRSSEGDGMGSDPSPLPIVPIQRIARGLTPQRRQKF